jgi:hypothetical protein
MRLLAILLTLLSILGCGASGGGGRSGLGFTNGLGVPIQDPVRLVQLPISQKQTCGSGLFVLSRFALQNNSNIEHHIDSFTGYFQSSLPGLTMNFELIIDGKPVYRQTYVDAGVKVVIPANITIQPGDVSHFTIEANPHQLMIGDAYRFIFESRIQDNESLIVDEQPIGVICNPGALFPSLITSDPMFIPHPTTSTIVAYVERLTSTSMVEQTLYDCDVRFRAGRRGQSVDLNLTGSVVLYVAEDTAIPNWRKIDEIPIYGHYVSHQYKMFFFEEPLSNTKLVKIELRLNNFKRGNYVRVSRLSIGSDTGFHNYPTRHGPDLRIP